MSGPCLDPCLPWFTPGCSPRADTTSNNLTLPNKAEREAWLEAEVARLSVRFQELAQTNEELTKKLAEKQAEKDKSDEVEELEDLGDMATAPDVQGITRAEEEPGNAVAAMSSPNDRLTAIGFDEKVEVVEIDGLARNDSGLSRSVSGRFNSFVIRGSAFNMKLPVKILIYALAMGGVIFVLAAAAVQLGAPDASSTEAVPGAATGWADNSGGHSRLLAGGGGGSSHEDATGNPHSGSHHSGHGLFAEVPRLLYNIAYALTGAGLMALIMNFLKQPLILGYLLGGMLVGPVCLGIVDSHHDIAELSELGLIFLLFMIGMELDVHELLKMGKVVLGTGFFQFPICGLSMFMVFWGLESAGLKFGPDGTFATMYCGMTCGISSTMIVAKFLGEKGEMGSPPGRLTIGILIFQDIWAIVVLAIQPNLANPEILGILKTFAFIVVLIIIALAYAKFVMPAVLFYASRSIELMLVLSLSWCFFICCTAILPFIGLSMELASLIAGVALATFPYSAEFNGKIKFIRDFFITLFFAGLGMQIPSPTIGAISRGLLVAVVVMIFRWLGIFSIVRLLGGGGQLACISTINLSQISEFALVICSMGMGFGHIQEETMTIIIWTFAILAILSSYFIGYNIQLYYMLERWYKRMLCKPQDDDDGHHDDGHEHEERDILFLGFHRIASMLVAEFQAKNPEILKRIHIIDVNQGVMPQLREKGVKCSYGDYRTPDVLEHCHHGEARIVICSIPDSALRGTSNAQLLKVVRGVWPQAHCIVTADNPYQAQQLYKAGADYVLRMARLCAERLQKMLSVNFTEATNATELKQVFERYRRKDRDFKEGSNFLSVKV